MSKSYKSGISVCITAYHSKKFIKETLDSISNQTWFKTHDNYEIIVGIDGDIEDAMYVHSLMERYKNIRVIVMESNEGTYVTTNTVMDAARYEWLLRFDSDDLMKSCMIERLMNNARHDIVRFYHNSPNSSSKEIAHGQIMMKHEIFDRFGGYRPWTCGADTEFEKRVFNFVDVYTINESLFVRRLFDNNLTTSFTTGMNSNLRKKNLTFILNESFKSEQEAKLNLVRNSFYEIFPTTDVSIIKIKDGKQLRKDADGASITPAGNHLTRRTAVYFRH